VLVKVLIADDHKMMRDGLRLIIDKQRNMEVVGEAEDGQDTVRQVRKLSPDIVVMDVAMPKLNGIEATRQIVASRKNTKVLPLSAHADRRYITEMLRAGASGYLLKHSASEELIEAIQTIIRGKTYLSPEIAETVVDEYRRAVTAETPSAFSQLTEREREVLQLLAEGQSRKEIASSLSLSVKTIGTHVEHIMEKLDIHSLPKLTKYAIREGLTGLD